MKPEETLETVKCRIGNALSCSSGQYLCSLDTKDADPLYHYGFGEVAAPEARNPIRDETKLICPRVQKQKIL